jgi:hypothetical protein
LSSPPLPSPPPSPPPQGLQGKAWALPVRVGNLPLPCVRVRAWCLADHPGGAVPRLAARGQLQCGGRHPSDDYVKGWIPRRQPWIRWWQRASLVGLVTSLG